MSSHPRSIQSMANHMTLENRDTKSDLVSWTASLNQPCSWATIWGVVQAEGGIDHCGSSSQSLCIMLSCVNRVCANHLHRGAWGTPPQTNILICIFHLERIFYSVQICGFSLFHEGQVSPKYFKWGEKKLHTPPSSTTFTTSSILDSNYVI